MGDLYWETVSMGEAPKPPGEPLQTRVEGGMAFRSGLNFPL
jgi:hypothetical protein